MGISQEVTVSTNISGVTDFKTTHVDTDLNGSGAANIATIKGVTDSPSDLSLDDQVEVHINDTLVFTGNIKRATQNDQRVITIEAYDSIADMTGRLVKLHTEELLRAPEVLRDLLVEVFGDNNVAPLSASVDPSTLSPGTFWVPPAEEFPSGAPTKKWYIGNGERGADMLNVVMEIADELNAVFWADHRNVVRIEPFPSEHKLYDSDILGRVVETDSGEQSEGTGEVIVDSPRSVSDLGPAASYVHSKTSVTSTVSHEAPDQPGQDNETITISNQNVTTKRGAEKYAVSKLVDRKMSATRGTLNVIGISDVRVWDSVDVPIHEEVELMEGLYTIAGVKHIVDTSNGFTTELNLRPDMHTTLSNTSGAPTAAEWAQYILQIRDSGYSFGYQ